MIRNRFLIFAWILVVARPACPGAEPASGAPDYSEVYDLVRAHVSGLTEAELNQKAVESLISALAPKVTLVGAPPTAGATDEAALLSKAMLYDGSVAYLRVVKVEDGLSKAVREACRLMSATNKLDGLVLDLRYTEGTDYSAAAATADLFLKKERPLLDWGKGMVSSKEKSDALSLPVAVLVNRQTACAAEALAAVLRETGTGLVVGAQTAGQAMIADEFPLKNGQRLRIGTAPLRLGGGQALSNQGLKPDIAVEVSAQDERAYYADGFKDVNRPNFASSRLSSTNQPGGTNRIRRPRFNEAELVRERKEGFNPDVEGAAEEDVLDKPIVRDPALARALDVLKGLAVVRSARGS